MIQTIVNEFSNLSLDDMDNVIELLKDIRNNKINDTFTLVHVYNSSGNISDRIKRDTNFYVFHKPSTIGGIGTNIIFIPNSKYTDDLRDELVSKYNNV
jgi:hypothetical protein